MNPVSFVVFGDAVPKQAFRFARKGNYQSPRVKEWEERVGWAARQIYQGEPATCNVRLTLVFKLSHKRRLDCDNLAKGTTDSLKGIVFEDDSQVVDLHVLKYQGEKEPQVYVYIEFIESAPVPLQPTLLRDATEPLPVGRRARRKQPTKSAA